MLIVDLKILNLIMTSNFPIGRLKLLVIKTSLLPAAARLVKVREEMILSKEIKGIVHQGSEEEKSSVQHGDYTGGAINL